MPDSKSNCDCTTLLKFALLLLVLVVRIGRNCLFRLATKLQLLNLVFVFVENEEGRMFQHFKGDEAFFFLKLVYAFR
jgi:hypothetical protein